MLKVVSISKEVISKVYTSKSLSLSYTPFSPKSTQMVILDYLYYFKRGFKFRILSREEKIQNYIIEART